MNTKKLKQLVLDLAIHGKLVPQDPNDEPASELLKRIKENVETHGRACKSKKSAISSENLDEVPFEVPEGWCWTTLGEIGKWQSGSTPSRSNKSYYGGTIPWLKTGDLNDGFITEIPEFITEEALKNTSVKLNPTDSVLIAMYGATIGKVGILTFPATTNQACCACCEYCIDKMYLFYFLIQERENFINKAGGGAQPNISKEIILSTLIPLPPLSEQRRIVAEIERWFGVIDQLESNEADLKKSIEQTKKKVLDLAIRGKLVPQEKEDEPARELLARIKENVETHGRASKGKKTAIPSVELDEVPFEVPEGWEWTTIGSISSNILYGVNESAKNSGEYKLLRITDIQDNRVDWNTVPVTDYDATKVYDYLLQKNDILFARTGATVGKSYLVEDEVANCIYASYLIKVQLNALLCSKYVKRYFESAYYWNLITENSIGTGQPNVNGTILASLTIPLPPLSEQHRIVSKIEEVFGVLDRIGEMVG